LELTQANGFLDRRTKHRAFGNEPNDAIRQRTRPRRGAIRASAADGRRAHGTPRFAEALFALMRRQRSTRRRELDLLIQIKLDGNTGEEIPESNSVTPNAVREKNEASSRHTSAARWHSDFPKSRNQGFWPSETWLGLKRHIFPNFR
jgi:hypothetical protein